MFIQISSEIYCWLSTRRAELLYNFQPIRWHASVWVCVVQRRIRYGNRAVHTVESKNTNNKNHRLAIFFPFSKAVSNVRWDGGTETDADTSHARTHQLHQLCIMKKKKLLNEFLVKNSTMKKKSCEYTSRVRKERTQHISDFNWNAVSLNESCDGLGRSSLCVKFFCVCLMWRSRCVERNLCLRQLIEFAEDRKRDRTNPYAEEMKEERKQRSSWINLYRRTLNDPVDRRFHSIIIIFIVLYRKICRFFCFSQKNNLDARYQWHKQNSFKRECGCDRLLCDQK